MDSRAHRAPQPQPHQHCTPCGHTHLPLNCGVLGAMIARDAAAERPALILTMLGFECLHRFAIVIEAFDCPEHLHSIVIRKLDHLEHWALRSGGDLGPGPGPGPHTTAHAAQTPAMPQHQPCLNKLQGNRSVNGCRRPMVARGRHGMRNGS